MISTLWITEMKAVGVIWGARHLFPLLALRQRPSRERPLPRRVGLRQEAEPAPATYSGGQRDGVASFCLYPLPSEGLATSERRQPALHELWPLGLWLEDGRKDGPCGRDHP